MRRVGNEIGTPKYLLKNFTKGRPGRRPRLRWEGNYTVS
jgi:hypothetical protein